MRLRRDELESRLLAVPAANWRQGAEKAGYQLNLFAATLAAQDSRKQNLVTAALADFKRLSKAEWQRSLRCLLRFFPACGRHRDIVVFITDSGYLRRRWLRDLVVLPP